MGILPVTHSRDGYATLFKSVLDRNEKSIIKKKNCYSKLIDFSIEVGKISPSPCVFLLIVS